MNHNVFNDKGLTGLVNLGNSCYMNTALQCLSNTLELTEYFLEDKNLKDIKDNDKGIILKEFIKLINGIWEENCIISPNSFHTNFRKYCMKYDIPNFCDFRQNDTHEFITIILDIMHEAIARKVNITISGIVVNELDGMALNAMKNWKDFFKSNYSKIIDIFYGQYISTISSLDKTLNSKNYEPFPSITLEIPNIDSANIYDCFDHFVSPEVLDGDNKYYWEEKKEHIISQKSIKIWNAPKVLIICLKRFFTKHNGIFKNNQFVGFPIDNLNLVKYCEGYDKFNSIYNLYGICNHSGGSGGGHYYAYCRNSNDKWYEYNDKRVTEINKSLIITDNAYCLFYKKIKY